MALLTQRERLRPAVQSRVGSDGVKILGGVCIDMPTSHPSARRAQVWSLEAGYDTVVYTCRFSQPPSLSCRRSKLHVANDIRQSHRSQPEPSAFMGLLSAVRKVRISKQVSRLMPGHPGTCRSPQNLRQGQRQTGWHSHTRVARVITIHAC